MQVIYINSSYLVESLISNSDRIKNLEEALKILIEKENIIKKLNQTILQRNGGIGRFRKEYKHLQEENKQKNDWIIELQEEAKK